MANERVDISTPVAKRCFQIAEAKQSSLIVAADLNTTDELLKCADSKYPCPQVD